MSARGAAAAAALVAGALLFGAAAAYADPAEDAGDDPAALEAAYRRVVARPHPRYLRPALESAVLVGVGMAWYWLDRERQVADWDLPSLHDRVTLEAWRFDNNPFPINFAWHAIDGGQYHVLARDSDLGLLPSIGYGLGTSFVWEYGVEFREKVSVNDMIVTTGAGTAFGEFFHWLGVYLESAPDPRPWHPIARWALTTTRTAHATFDHRATLRAGTRADALGLSSDIWHRFHTAIGVDHATFGGAAADAPGDDALPLVQLSARGELAVLPGYLTAPRLSRGFRDGNLSRASARVSLGADAIGLEIAADALLCGYHHQELTDGVGAATTVGLSLAYQYRRELFGPWVERLAQMHLPGLAFDQHVLGRRAAAHLRGRLHGDFAGLHAVAYPAWRAAHPDVVEKTILRKHGYYYAWGLAAGLEAEVELPRVTVGGAVEYATYDSQEGLDRAQEEVTADVDAADRLLTWDAWARVAPLGGRLYLEGRIAGEERDGHLGELAASQELRRYTLELGATW